MLTRSMVLLFIEILKAEREKKNPITKIMNIDMPFNSSNYLVKTKQYRDASLHLKIIGETCILNLIKEGQNSYTEL